MGRFLIRFSYFGTRYSGLQRQTNLTTARGKPIVTIEGALQNALKHLMPVNEVKITLSSRTDKGVHSLRNACHVDLQNPNNGKEYIPEVITNVVNYHLKAHRHDIRVLETQRVTDDFHARFRAVERHYIYRLAHTPGQTAEGPDHETFLKELIKYSTGHSKHPRHPFGESLVIPDANHIRAYKQPLNLGKLIKAAELLSGIHNYSSFTKRIGQQSYFPHPVKLLTIGVKRGQALGAHMYGNTQYHPRNLEYWDIHVRAKSFLYRQIRRIVGGMVLVARDKITLEDLEDVLDNPRTQFPFSSIMGLDEFGLFLKDVIYKPEDLKFVDFNQHVMDPQAEEQFCCPDYPTVTGEESIMGREDGSGCDEVDGTTNCSNKEGKQQLAHIESKDQHESPRYPELLQSSCNQSKGSNDSYALNKLVEGS